MFINLINLFINYLLVYLHINKNPQIISLLINYQLQSNVLKGRGLSKTFYFEIKPLFSNTKGKQPIIKWKSDYILPSLYIFRSSRQIEDNIQIIHQTSKQVKQRYYMFLHTKWPQSCVGLVLCEHRQNNQIFYVYGTGTLIQKNIVLTSAQNVYCRRLHTQYNNIKFIAGVCDNKCSGIYDVMRVHYPNEYTMQDYKNYNFAVLQLYDDLSDSCGYVGWKSSIKPTDKKIVGYGYMNDSKQGFLHLQQIKKYNKFVQEFEGSGILIKEEKNKYYIVGLYNRLQTNMYSVLSDKLMNIISEWTTIKKLRSIIHRLDILYDFPKNITTNPNEIILNNNEITGQMCKSLSQVNFTYLTKIFLENNSIDAIGCKYLTQATWIHLTTINLNGNFIKAQGCRYLSEAKWIHLTEINLDDNQISEQGCKYISQADWKHLAQISLENNNIGAQGCKYLSQVDWTYLSEIYLNDNRIDFQGRKYMTQANWKYLRAFFIQDIKINLINKIIFRQLWPIIQLSRQNQSREGGFFKQQQFSS